MRNLSHWFKAENFNLYYFSQMFTQPHPVLLISAHSDPCLYGLRAFRGSSESQYSGEINTRGLGVSLSHPGTPSRDVPPHCASVSLSVECEW